MMGMLLISLIIVMLTPSLVLFLPNLILGK
jgi:hypothetical protein